MARLKIWLLSVVAVLVLAGAAVPADAQVVVRLGHRHHRHYHHHYHHRYHR